VLPLQYINKDLSRDPDMPKFMGEPRLELDQAWHSLLEGTLIRYSEEELLRANNATSVRYREGGFVGGLGVSHSLHCLVSHVVLCRVVMFTNSRRNESSSIYIQSTITTVETKIGMSFTGISTTVWNRSDSKSCAFLM
jgi:hypothetical protein